MKKRWSCCFTNGLSIYTEITRILKIAIMRCCIMSQNYQDEHRKFHDLINRNVFWCSSLLLILSSHKQSKLYHSVKELNMNNKREAKNSTHETAKRMIFVRYENAKVKFSFLLFFFLVCSSRCHKMRMEPLGNYKCHSDDF